MRNTIISTALATIALAAAAPAAADEINTVEVEWQDLNLSTESGQDTLQGRISAAINEVCPRGEVRSVRDTMDAQTCREMAQEDADQQVQQLRRGSVRILAIRAQQPRG